MLLLSVKQAYQHLSPKNNTHFYIIIDVNMIDIVLNLKGKFRFI